MSVPLGYISCAVVAILILFQGRIVRQLVRSTRRLQDVFLLPSPGHGRQERRDQGPLTLRLGSPMPNFLARRLLVGSDSIDRAALIGESTVIMFCRGRQLESWDAKVLVAILRGCWMRVDGLVYICVPSGDHLDLKCPTVVALRNCSIADDIVLARDQDGSLWGAFGVHTTPCVVQLDRSGVLQQYGIVTVAA